MPSTLAVNAANECVRSVKIVQHDYDAWVREVFGGPIRNTAKTRAHISFSVGTFVARITQALESGAGFVLPGTCRVYIGDAPDDKRSKACVSSNGSTCVAMRITPDYDGDEYNEIDVGVLARQARALVCLLRDSGLQVTASTPQMQDGVPEFTLQYVLRRTSGVG
jgi:hypothetical protein